MSNIKSIIGSALAESIIDGAVRQEKSICKYTPDCIIYSGVHFNDAHGAIVWDNGVKQHIHYYSEGCVIPRLLWDQMCEVWGTTAKHYIWDWGWERSDLCPPIA